MDSRGFSLKPRFVHSIYSASTGALLFSRPSRTTFLRAPPLSLRRSGCSIASPAAIWPTRPINLGLSPSLAKNAQATVVRSILGLPARGKTKEFERFGLQVKTVPMLTSGRILEAMSFPAFRLIDLGSEVWEE